MMNGVVTLGPPTRQVSTAPTESCDLVDRTTTVWFAAHVFAPAARCPTAGSRRPSGVPRRNLRENAERPDFDVPALPHKRELSGRVHVRARRSVGRGRNTFDDAPFTARRPCVPFSMDSTLHPIRTPLLDALEIRACRSLGHRGRTCRPM